MGNRISHDTTNYLQQTCEEHDGSINCMDISEDGSVLATGSDDTNVRLWTTKTMLVECIGVLEGHDDYITSIIIEDSFVLSSSADKTVRKWDMSTCECVLVFIGHESIVNRMVCTGDFLFTVSYDKTARCWDYDTSECVRVFSGHKSNVVSILFVPSDNKNVFEDAEKFVATKKEVFNRNNQNIKLIDSEMNSYKKRVIDENDNIYSKDIIITGSLDSLAKSWSVETGECIQTFKGHDGAVTCLAIDNTGQVLFTGSADHLIKSWEISTGLLLKNFKGHQTTVITLLPYKKLLYSTSSDHTAKSWIMEFGDCTRTYKGHTHSVATLIESKGLSKHFY
jgi:WD repeat-containing protein 86